MSFDVLLSRLERIQRTGADRYIARCPAHADRSPSLSIRGLDDGRVLIHCFAGCPVTNVLAALELEISALFPPQPLMTSHRPERRPFPAADVLRCVAFESLVVATAGTALLNGRPFSALDRDRLLLAVSRLQSAAQVAGLNHG